MFSQTQGYVMYFSPINTKDNLTYYLTLQNKPTFILDTEINMLYKSN